jgi:hypothetical protein
LHAGDLTAAVPHLGDFDEGDFVYSDDDDDYAESEATEEGDPMRPFGLKAGWEVAASRSTGKQYYINTLTNETQVNPAATPARTRACLLPSLLPSLLLLLLLLQSTRLVISS